MKKAIIALATLGCISSKSFALNEYLLVDLNVASKCHATLTYQTPKFKHERELKINLLIRISKLLQNSIMAGVLIHKCENLWNEC